LQCANNLKLIAVGLFNYAGTHFRSPSPEEHGAELPSGTVANPELAPERRLSWLVEVLPFVEQLDLYKRLDLRASWDAEPNAPVAHTPLNTFQCPDWGREAAPNPPYLTAYLGVAGRGRDAALSAEADRTTGVFGYDRRTGLAAIPDGTSRTLMILESARENGPWAQGGPATVRGLDPGEQPYLGVGRQFGGTHFGENTVFGKGKSLGCNAALADGSVRFLAESIAPAVLEALVTVAGGEEIGENW
jgi:hypothetical protein